MDSLVNTSTDPWNITILTHLNEEMFRRLTPAFVVFLIFMLVGVCGNLIICYIFGFKLRKSCQNFLLLSLGGFDLMSSLVGLPSEIVDISHYYIYKSTVACKITRFLTTLPSFGSILILVAIAVDRYRKICTPLKAQMYHSHAKKALGLVILIALVFSIPALVLYGHRSIPTPVPGVSGHDCSMDDSYQKTVFPLVYESVLSFFFILFTVMLVCIYSLIWLQTKNHRRFLRSHSATERSPLMGNTPSSPAPDNNQCSNSTSTAMPHQTDDTATEIRRALPARPTTIRNSRSTMQASRTTVIAFVVTLGFILSYLPHLILMLLRYVQTDYDLEHDLSDVPLNLYNIGLRSYFANNVIDIFVYASMNSDFRNEMYELLNKVKPECSRNYNKLEDKESNA